MIELTDSLTSIANQRDVLPEAVRVSWLSSPSMPASCSALVQSVGAVKSHVGPPVLDELVDDDELVEDELDVLDDDVLDDDVLEVALPEDDADVVSLLVVSPPAPPPPVSSVPP